MNLFTAAIASWLSTGAPVMVQGALENLGGAVDGLYDIQILVYPNQSDPTVVAAQTHEDVPVVDGRFSFALTVLEPKHYIDNEELWIDCRVNGQVLGDRFQLGVAPFAGRAHVATDLTCTGCVHYFDIADFAIDSRHLGSFAVSTEKIAWYAVTSERIATGGVRADNIGEGAVTSHHIYPGAVDTAALGDLAVTGKKLALNAVTTENVAYRTLIGEDLATGAVGWAEIADNSIRTSHVDSINASRVKFFYKEGSFCNHVTPFKLSTSVSTIACFLTHVDDDSPAGYCSVRREADGWYVQTGGGCGENDCRYLCIY